MVLDQNELATTMSTCNEQRKYHDKIVKPIIYKWVGLINLYFIVIMWDVKHVILQDRCFCFYQVPLVHLLELRFNFTLLLSNPIGDELKSLAYDDDDE
jgi:hypothetical protein